MKVMRGVIEFISERNGGESDLVGASHRRVTRTGRVVVEDRCAWNRSKKWQQYTIYCHPFPPPFCKKPRGRSRCCLSQWEGRARGGEYVCSEGERYDNVERVDTRDVSVGEERKKIEKRERGGLWRLPPKESKVSSSRDPRRAAWRGGRRGEGERVGATRGCLLARAPCGTE